MHPPPPPLPPVTTRDHPQEPARTPRDHPTRYPIVVEAQVLPLVAIQGASGGIPLGAPGTGEGAGSPPGAPMEHSQYDGCYLV